MNVVLYWHYICYLLSAVLWFLSTRLWFEGVSQLQDYWRSSWFIQGENEGRGEAEPGEAATPLLKRIGATALFLPHVSFVVSQCRQCRILKAKGLRLEMEETWLHSAQSSPFQGQSKPSYNSGWWLPRSDPENAHLWHGMDAICP